MDINNANDEANKKIDEVTDKLYKNEKVNKVMKKAANSNVVKKLPLEKVQIGVIIAALVSMVLPLFNVGIDADFGFVSSSSSTSANGFQMLFGGDDYDSCICVVLLFVLPILGIITNFIPKLKKYHTLCSWIVGIGGIVSLILVAIIFAASSSSSEVVDISIKPSIGFFVALICYIIELVSQLLLSFNAKKNK